MKILAIDDERDTRQLMKDLLSHAGHQVTTASDAVEALAHLQMARYELVLLDMMMPGIDGAQLAQYLSTHWNTFDIPVLVVSCRKDAECKSWAQLNGCVGYIEKPFSPSELLDAVARVEKQGGTNKALPA